MDTSETYVKMCDCEEVQGGHVFKDGDFFISKIPYQEVQGDDWPCIEKPAFEPNVIHSAWRYNDHDPHWREKCIWLPRQDQIQEMIDDWPTIIIMHHGGEYLIEMKPEGEAIDEKGFGEMFGKYYARSLEQAWLMLYMHQKHKKTWDKDKWVDLEGK